MEILELKNTTTQMKNLPKGLKGRFELTEEELVNLKIELCHLKSRAKKKERKMNRTSEKMKHH